MAALTITAASVVAVSGDRGQGTAGATLTAGLSLYADATDSDKLKGADADVTASSVCVGIALHAAASGQPISYLKLVPGSVITIGATVAVGMLYCVGLTAGDIVPYGDLGSGDFVSMVGVGSTTGQLTLFSYNSQVAKA